MESGGIQTVSFPAPSKWNINADIAGRPIIWGTLIINSVSRNKVTGTINFRGVPIPINGIWNEGSKQITFDSPYATFTGSLTIFDDQQIKIRHFILQGRLVMKPPSLQAGEYGTWIATTDICLSDLPAGGSSLPQTHAKGLPPVGVFVISEYSGKICR